VEDRIGDRAGVEVAVRWSHTPWEMLDGWSCNACCGGHKPRELTLHSMQKRSRMEDVICLQRLGSLQLEPPLQAHVPPVDVEYEYVLSWRASLKPLPQFASCRAEQVRLGYV
jgi:hypothetical protein